MMMITVRLFATLRQQAGWSSQQIELATDATVQTLMDFLETENESLILRDRSVYAAVNQNYVGIDTVLHDGDEVALFPPVSGGRDI